jgi:hypothetical protein
MFRQAIAAAALGVSLLAGGATLTEAKAAPWDAVTQVHYLPGHRHHYHRPHYVPPPRHHWRHHVSPHRGWRPTHWHQPLRHGHRR